MTQLNRLSAVVVSLTAAIILSLLLLTHPAGANSAACDVPSSNYSTIQSAIDDDQCRTVNLTAPQYTEHVVISRTVMVRGQGAANTRVDGANNGTVFTIHPNGRVALVDMTISNGLSDNGGGIYNDGGILALLDCNISGNKARGNGAGVYSRGDGRLAVIDSIFMDNLAGSDGGGFGGAIYNEGGVVHIRNSQLTDNEAGIYEALAGGRDGILSHERGGAIHNQGGAVIIRDSGIHRNQSVAGGGIFNAGAALTVTNSTFTNNESKDGNGGAINNEDGTVTISASNFVSNGANFGGGAALYNLAGTVSVVESTFDDNGADWGGALSNHSSSGNIGTTAIVRSTLVNNRADFGAAVFNSTGTITIANSTLSGNSGGAGIYTQGGLLRIGSSTLSANSGSGNSGNAGGIYNASADSIVKLINTIIVPVGDEAICGGNPITSLGHNIATDNTCNLSATGDQPNTDPLLGPLQDNGGPTWTHALQPGSPAIDAGDNAACTGRDQRGVSRPQDGNGDGVALCDIGALEMAP